MAVSKTADQGSSPCVPAMSLVDFLIKEGWLKTDRIIKAFEKVKREDFLPARIGYSKGVADGPENIKGLAELNEALPIGSGQTISQPLTVAFMLELLQPKEREKILDVGSGSGWTTTLLAEIVGDKGKIIALEVVLELKDFGEKNASKYNFVKKGIVKFILADGSKGYENEAPYDKILASASGIDLPESWKKQL